MFPVLYSYIAKPTKPQVRSFLRALTQHGISISHLGKSDPPGKFCGNTDEAVDLIFGGTDLTNYTFVRDAAHKLDFDIQIHHDPRWTHSTVSASCSDSEMLRMVAESASEAFDLFITVRGASGGGKEQPWEVVHSTESCPPELRSRFIAA